MYKLYDLIDKLTLDRDIFYILRIIHENLTGYFRP